MKKTQSNDYIVEGSTVRVDISTKKFPKAETLIDIDDIDLILDERGRWCCWSANNNYPPYVLRNKKPRHSGVMSLHREIVKRFLNNVIQVDHKDGDPLNNKRNNLRSCTTTQNLQNSTKRTNATSKYKGVYYHKQSKKYRALISLNGQRKYLGCFENEIDAAIAYDKVAATNFGEFAKLNFQKLKNKGELL